MAKRTKARSTAKGCVAKRAASSSAANAQAKSAGTARKKKSAAKLGAAGRPPTRKLPAKTAASKRKTPTIASPATSQDPIRFLDESRPLPKTRLTEKDLEEFRDLLLRKRAELCGDVERLTSEALSSKGQGQADHSAMPIHMADLGSDNWEQEFTLGLMANEQALVREIDEALARIEDKTYGICLATHKRISKARLRAKPWAKYCIAYARAREEGRAS